MVSSVIHMKGGCDYNTFMKNSSIPPAVYPHQWDRTGVRSELASPKFVWQNDQTTVSLGYTRWQTAYPTDVTKFREAANDQIISHICNLGH